MVLVAFAETKATRAEGKLFFKRLDKRIHIYYNYIVDT